jgi:hypothetical protein
LFADHVKKIFCILLKLWCIRFIDSVILIYVFARQFLSGSIGIEKRPFYEIESSSVYNRVSTADRYADAGASAPLMRACG